jgi:hypothetical protein
MRFRQLGRTGWKVRILGLAVTVVVTLRGAFLPAQQIEAFAIKEHYGVSHPDQIIDFELNRKIDAANAHMVGAAARQSCSNLSRMDAELR